jgi:DNA-binding NtrC family response regulator
MWRVSDCEAGGRSLRYLGGAMRDELDVTTLDPADAPAADDGLSTNALTVVFHEDPTRIGERALLDRRARVAVSRKQPPFGPPGAQAQRPLSSRHLSRQPLYIHGNVVEARDCPVHADGERIDGTRSFGEAAIERGVVLELGERVVLLLHRVQPLQTRAPELGLVGESAAMHRLRQQILRVAPHDVPVLLRGETGTGKDLVARAIHQASGRAAQPFVSVNMAAIPATTAASSLFGHAKGAFTGAVQASRGYFGTAHRGTLFLDEIGDTPHDVQAMLLRALESGEAQTLGDELPSRVDVRLIAATDSDLERAVDEGHFRLSLLKRLGGYALLLPALRHRREDIARLLLHFMGAELQALRREDRLAPREPPWLPAWLMAAAVRHDWSGNVRELRNFARQLAISWCDSAQIPRSDEIFEALGDQAPRLLATAPAPRRTSDIDEAEVLAALARHDYKPAAAATELGVSRTSMFKLMKNLPNVRSAAGIAADEVRAALRNTGGDVAAAAMALKVSQRALRLRIKTLNIE